MDMEKLYAPEGTDWDAAYETHKSMPATFDREWLAHYAVVAVLARIRVSRQVILLSRNFPDLLTTTAGPARVGAWQTQ